MLISRLFVVVKDDHQLFPEIQLHACITIFLVHLRLHMGHEIRLGSHIPMHCYVYYVLLHKMLWMERIAGRVT